MSDAGGSEQLNAALRNTAAQAAAAVGGGCALIFTMGAPDSTDGAVPRLRAAAGFADPNAARAAATSLVTAVTEAIESGKVMTAAADPALGPRGAGGLTVLPMDCGEAVVGVLVVTSPTALEEPIKDQLALLAWAAATILDHARACRELEGLRATATENSGKTDENGDELLQLSEALFAQDIELLRNNERLSKIEKLKNDFIEKMSRELRTPLNSIIEATISVLAGENERLSDQAKLSLRNALDEGTAFQRTLQNILDLWRVKQSELPVEIQEVNFAEVIEEAIFSVQDSLEDKPVTIEKRLADGLPKIRTDLTKVNHILFLLLDNAAKFTHEGPISISAEVSEDLLVCEVRDSGIGICPDDQEFIWEEFFQVDELTSTKYRGAGLGLTLVKDLLLLLGGDCSLTSEAGKGTAVTFRIPVQPILA